MKRSAREKKRSDSKAEKGETYSDGERKERGEGGCLREGGNGKEKKRRVPGVVWG